MAVGPSDIQDLFKEEFKRHKKNSGTDFIDVRAPERFSNEVCLCQIFIPQPKFPMMLWPVSLQNLQQFLESQQAANLVSDLLKNGNSIVSIPFQDWWWSQTHSYQEDKSTGWAGVSLTIPVNQTSATWMHTQ